MRPHLCEPCVNLVMQETHGNTGFRGIISGPLGYCLARLRCDLSPPHTQIVATFNLALKWAVGTERNGWMMLILCIGETLFGGILGGHWA